VGTEKRERQKANRALKHQQEVQAAARKKLYRKVGIGIAAVAAIVLFVWISSNIVGGDDDEPITPVTLPGIPLDTVPLDTAPVDTAPVDTTETTGG
jgi:hypothetical protein